MEIEKLGPSMTVLKLNDGARVLFSYETPVAARTAAGEYVKSEKYFSRTTAGHVSKWLDGAGARTIPHADMLKLTQGAR